MFEAHGFSLLAVMGSACFSGYTLSTEKSGSHTAGRFVMEDLHSFIKNRCVGSLTEIEENQTKAFFSSAESVQNRIK